MKNIIILGSSRAGKSTLASLICKKYNYSYVSGDSIRNAFINIYPELGYTTKNTIEKIEFCKFINFIINQNNIHLKRDVYYVIDSADISIQNAKDIFKNSLIIAIGCKNIDEKELAENIKNNDTKLDWTYGYSDNDLKDIAHRTIKRSKEIYNECVEMQIPYFDTSINRKNTYDKIFEFIDKELGEENER